MVFLLRHLYFIQLSSITLENVFSSSVFPILQINPSPFQQKHNQPTKDKSARGPSTANNFSCIRHDLTDFHKYYNGMFG